MPVAPEPRRTRVLMFDLLPSVPYYTAHLCQSLKALTDVDLRLASSTYPHDTACFTRLNIRRIPILCSLRHLAAISILRRPSRLIEVMVNLALLTLYTIWWRPEVVHVQFTPLLERLVPFELWYLRIARMMGARIVLTVHNVLPHERTSLQRRAYSILYSFADALICHDDKTRTRLLEEFPVADTKLVVLPHGPLFARQGAGFGGNARERLGIPHDRLLVLWQGIIRPYKGIQFLLQAWKKYTDGGGKALLVIAGSGDEPHLRQITSDIHSKGLDSSVHCDFRFIPVTDLLAYHAAADIVVYPYESISSSGALLTSMAHGKATIASTLPGFQEVLSHNVNSLLVPYGDVAGWAEAIQRLSVEPELRAQLGDALRHTSETHTSWTEIAGRTRDLYLAVEIGQMTHQSATA